VTLTTPADPNRTSALLNVRVADAHLIELGQLSRHPLS
jgi:hypothetical protein